MLVQRRVLRKEILDTLGKVHQVYPETTIYGFIGDDDTLLDGADILDYRTSSVDTDVHLVLFGWFIECYTQMDQDKLVKMRKEILQLGTFVGEAIAGAKEFAQQLIATVDVAKPQMWVTSGRLWGEVCCFCNYILKKFNGSKHSRSILLNFSMVHSKWWPRITKST